jgi:hypothetical protein
MQMTHTGQEEGLLAAAPDVQYPPGVDGQLFRQGRAGAKAGQGESQG